MNIVHEYEALGYPLAAEVEELKELPRIPDVVDWDHGELDVVPPDAEGKQNCGMGEIANCCHI